MRFLVSEVPLYAQKLFFYGVLLMEQSDGVTHGRMTLSAGVWSEIICLRGHGLETDSQIELLTGVWPVIICPLQSER